MNYLDYEVLKNRKDITLEEEKEKCFEVVEQLVELSMIAHKEGLLAMDEYADVLSDETIPERYYKDAILLVCDGNDPEFVEQFLSNDIVFYGTETFDGYLCYLIMKGILAIQAGDNYTMLREKLKHSLPFSLREEAANRVEETVTEYREELRNRRKEEVDRFYPKKTKNPFLPVVIEKLYCLSETELQHFLKQAELNDVLILLSYSPESLRVSMLNNVPDSIKNTFFEEVRYFTNEEVSKALCTVMSSLKNY